MNQDEWLYTISFLTERDLPSVMLVCSEWNNLLKNHINSSRFWIDRHIEFLNNQSKLYRKLIDESLDHAGMRRFFNRRILHHQIKIQKLAMMRFGNCNFRARQFLGVKKYEDSNNCCAFIRHVYYRDDILKSATTAFVWRDLNLVESNSTISEMVRYMLSISMECFSLSKQNKSAMGLLLPRFLDFWSGSDLSFWKLLLNNYSSLKLDKLKHKFYTSYFTEWAELKESEEVNEVVMKFLKVTNYEDLTRLSAPFQLKFTPKVVSILKEEKKSFFQTCRGYSYYAHSYPSWQTHIETIEKDRKELIDFLHEKLIYVGGISNCHIFKSKNVDIYGTSSNGANWLVNFVNNFPKQDVTQFFHSPLFKSLKLDWKRIDPDMNLLNHIILQEDQVSKRLQIIKAFHEKNVTFTDQLLSNIVDRNEYGGVSSHKEASTVRETIEYLVPLTIFQHSNESFQQYYNENISLVRGNACKESNPNLILCFKVWKIIG